MSDLTDRLRYKLSCSWDERIEAADEIDRLTAEVQQLRADNTDLQNKVVMPLRERVAVLEQALYAADLAFAEHGILAVHATRIEIRAALKGEACSD